MQCDSAAQPAVVSRIQNELAISFADDSFVAASQIDKAKQMGAMVSCNA